MLNNNELAIIILNYNTFDQTIVLVNQIHNLGYPIIVVDNASSNNSWNEIKNNTDRFENVYLIKSEVNGGYSKGNNVGIRFAVERFEALKYIAIMNPDIEMCREDTFKVLCDALEADDTLAGITAMTIFNNVFFQENPCAARFLSDNDMIIADVAVISKWIRRSYWTILGNDSGVSYVDKIQGCFFIMKKEIFEKVGYLDENVFLYYEEDILGKKIKKQGYKLGVFVGESIKHNHGTKDIEMIDLKKRQFYNKCMLESKKYYMLHIAETPYWKWRLSYLLDSTTRNIKDLLLKLKGH